MNTETCNKQVNLKYIMLSEKSQSPKATYCIIHFYDIMEKTKLSVLKQAIDCQGLGMRAEVDYKGVNLKEFGG